MIIAVDFDGTLCEERYPEIGEPFLDLINTLKYAREKGNKLILWTCRNNELLDNAVEWCRKFGLIFDAVNENLPEILEIYNNVDSRKISYDILIDDKNINVANLNYLKRLNSLQNKFEVTNKILGEIVYNVPKTMIPLEGLTGQNGQQYLTLNDKGDYFACGRRTYLKQSFTPTELEFIPEVYKQFIPAQWRK